MTEAISVVAMAAIWITALICNYLSNRGTEEG